MTPKILIYSHSRIRPRQTNTLVLLFFDGSTVGPRSWRARKSQCNGEIAARQDCSSRAISGSRPPMVSRPGRHCYPWRALLDNDVPGHPARTKTCCGSTAWPFVQLDRTCQVGYMSALLSDVPCPPPNSQSTRRGALLSHCLCTLWDCLVALQSAARPCSQSYF